MPRDIPLSEWEQYDWIDVRHLRSTGPLFARGQKKLGPPPDDGYVYQREGDRWVRAQTISPPPAEGE